MMNIEAGKFYRTRDGRKVRIYATDGNDLPIHGAYLGENGWEVAEWHSDGTWIKGCRHGLDIIGPWIEKPVVDWPAMPKWAKYVCQIGVDRLWAVSDRKPEQHKGQSNPKSVYYFQQFHFMLIPPEYAPKYEGPWEDSLVERPEGE